MKGVLTAFIDTVLLIKVKFLDSKILTNFVASFIGTNPLITK